MTVGVAPLTILQLSDLHLFDQSQQNLLGLNTNYSLQQILKVVKGLQHQLDIILLTGDLAQDASAGAYQSLIQLFSGISVPVYFVPGNHDQPELMTATLTSKPFHSEQVFSLGGWQFILLDSSIPDQVHGALSPETLTKLDTTLNACNQPTTLALHHPAHPAQSDWLDDGLENYEALWSVLDRHPQVQIVLSGHVHQEMTFSRRGVQYLTTPSTCIQFKPRSATFALDKNDPGFRLLTLFADGSFQSWVERVPISQQANLNAAGY